MLFQTTILARREVAQGTQEVTFKRPDKFSFSAGQHMQVQLSSLMKPDAKGTSRLFSVVSSPYDMEHVKVVFRASGSGFKDTLLSLPLDETVTIEQANGSFVLPQEPKRQNIFIAGGVGVAPFMSYLYQKVPDAWQQSITLIYGNRSPENAAYLKEIKEMEKIQRSFNFIELYKKPTQKVFQESATKFPDAVWWVVGPPAMVAVTVGGLHAGGIPGVDILTESFEGY